VASLSSGSRSLEYIGREPATHSRMSNPRTRDHDAHTPDLGVAPRQGAFHPTIYPQATRYVIVPTMRLADRITQCRTPFIVQNTKDGATTHLSGAATFAGEILACPTRYVLCDDLTRLCTALAYSKGTNTLACADLLHVPAERVWVEWCEAPWHAELTRYGFKTDEQSIVGGRRGAFIQSSATGRRGLMRVFWTTGETDLDVLASSMEAYFDFDTQEGEAPAAPDASNAPTISVFHRGVSDADILRRCFRFRYERTWAEYYANTALTSQQRDAVARHALGTIAIEIPVILAFFLLLATRPGLPRRPLMLERLNRARSRSGKAPLLAHMEVFAPLIPEYAPRNAARAGIERRPRRLHHVRGHLVRRGSQLFWRVPHFRGSWRAGVVRTRTVTWTMDGPAGDSPHSSADQAIEPPVFVT
jgi:hypothetical protein